MIGILVNYQFHWRILVILVYSRTHFHILRPFMRNYMDAPALKGWVIGVQIIILGWNHTMLLITFTDYDFYRDRGHFRKSNVISATGIWDELLKQPR